MKSILIAILLTTVSVGSFAQELFQEGYFIDNDGNKVQCLIKNEDWIDNPSELQYRLTENDPPLSVGINDINEFKVGGTRYLRAVVEIDHSSDKSRYLSNRKELLTTLDTVFLNFLVEGEADLFVFRDSEVQRFFLRMKDEEIQPLKYKKYKTTDGVMTNTAYRRQLMRNILCGDITVERLSRIRYTNNELIKIISEFNNCVESENILYENQSLKKTKISFIVRPGLRLASFNVGSNINSLKNVSDYNDQNSFQFGLQMKFDIPSRNNKWAITFEPTYQQYSSTGELKFGNTADQSTEIQYTSIEVPIGLRYYVNFSKKSRIFLSPYLIIDTPIGDSFVETKEKYKISSSPNISIGIGYEFDKTYSIEIQKGLKRALLTDTGFDSNYNYISFQLGYKIF